MAKSVYLGALRPLPPMGKSVHNLAQMVITATVEIQVEAKKRYGATQVIHKNQQKSFVTQLGLLIRTNV